MAKSELQQVLECFETADVRSYSGRGMFGKKCLAVVLDSEEDFLPDLIQAAADTRPNMQALADEVRGMRKDSMGLGVVLYWPNVAFVEEGDEDDGPPSEDEPDPDSKEDLSSAEFWG